MTRAERDARMAKLLDEVDALNALIKGDSWPALVHALAMAKLDEWDALRRQDDVERGRC